MHGQAVGQQRGTGAAGQPGAAQPQVAADLGASQPDRAVLPLTVGQKARVKQCAAADPDPVRRERRAGAVDQGGVLEHQVAADRAAGQAQRARSRGLGSHPA